MNPPQSRCECEGWWEQAGFGRQPMEQLTLGFANGRIWGAGVDIIAPFTFSGTIDRGAVAMIKQYHGLHSVQYLGVYDGEGLLTGEWRVPGDRGPWMIRIRRLASAASDEIVEYRPVETPS